ncbi:hypothetical protein [Paraburkholderia sp. J67]|uniref:hypothetical protein n=1 Tax=Paraburkholderia sp. J67 TaxID=2805435 RepID=UPI002ABE657D|nr:hypothetical protein [Paraburkholderia sp. J67]
MRNTKERSWKAIAWVIVMIFGLSIGVIAMLNNPSKVESEEHLATMTRDMDAALKTGGVVDSTYSNAKIGGSLLIKDITAHSWNPEMAKAYQLELTKRGWVQRSNDGNVITLCKNHMLAKINTFPEKDSSRGLPRDVYAFSMIYDARTAKECR